MIFYDIFAIFDIINDMNAREFIVSCRTCKIGLNNSSEPYRVRYVTCRQTSIPFEQIVRCVLLENSHVYQK